MLSSVLTQGLGLARLPLRVADSALMLVLSLHLLVLGCLYVLLTHRRALQRFFRWAMKRLGGPSRGLARFEDERASRWPSSWRERLFDASTEVVVASLSGSTCRVSVSARTKGIELKALVAARLAIPEFEVLLVPPGATAPIADEEQVPLPGTDEAKAVPEVPWSLVRQRRRLVLSGAKDGKLKLWDLDRGVCVRTMRAQGAVFSVSADWGRRLAISGSEDGRPRLWDLGGGRCVEEFGAREACADNPVFCISVDWARRRAVSGSFGALFVWDLDGGPARELKGGCGFICSVEADWANCRAVTCSGDQSLRLWDLKSGASECLPGHSGAVFSASVDWPSLRALTASADRTLRLWDLGRRVCSRVLEGHTSGVCAVAADWLAERAVSGSSDRSLRVWDLQSGACLAQLLGHGDAVWCVALDWGRRCALSGSYDRTLRVWDLEGGECTATLKGHEGHVLALSLSA